MKTYSHISVSFRGRRSHFLAEKLFFSELPLNAFASGVQSHIWPQRQHKLDISTVAGDVSEQLGWPCPALPSRSVGSFAL